METARTLHAPHPPAIHPVDLPDDAPPRSGAARRGFEALAARWHLTPAQAWTVLTGQPRPALLLTAEQARRVALLLAAEAKLAAVLTHTDVGTWMTTPNPAPALAGLSPLDHLARAGTPGFVALLQNARRWARP